MISKFSILIFLKNKGSQYAKESKAENFYIILRTKLGAKIMQSGGNRYQEK
jgi:hypothetical protein